MSSGKGEWYIAQALEVDVTSQGETLDEALANLREALELYFEPPVATIAPSIYRIEVEIPAGTEVRRPLAAGAGSTPGKRSLDCARVGAGGRRWTRRTYPRP